MKNNQPTAEKRPMTREFFDQHTIKDQISVLPAGLESFYSPSSQRQIKNYPSLRSLRLCGETKLLLKCHINGK